MESYGIIPAPLLYSGPYNFDKMCELAEGLTVLGGGNHVREGVVVRPIKERVNERLGRAVIKFVGAGFTERS